MRILIGSDYAVDSKRKPFPSQAFGELLPLIGSADIAVYNQEFPVTLSTQRNRLKVPEMCFRSLPETLDLVRDAGFNLACLANNHTYNWCADGLSDTIAALTERGIQTVGAGHDVKEAARIKYITVSGETVAFLNFAEIEQNCATYTHGGANPLDVFQGLKQLRTAKSKASVAFVIIHSGIDFQLYPSLRLVNTCRFFIDMGADGVFCHHSHVVSGYETYQGKPIFYGMGNMLSNIIVQASCYYTCAVELEILQGEIQQITPHYFKYDTNNQKLKSLVPEDDPAFFKDLAHVSSLLTDERALLDAELTNMLNNKLTDKYLTHFTRSSYKVYYLMRRLGLTKLHLRYIMNKTRRMKNRWNLIRCPTHRDVLELIFIKHVDI